MRCRNEKTLLLNTIKGLFDQIIIMTEDDKKEEIKEQLYHGLNCYLQIDDIIDIAIQSDASDIHLIAGRKPMLRIIRKLEPIEQYDKQGRFIKEWSSLAEASEILKISRGTLCSALKGDINSCGGYQWKYKDSDKIINIYTISSLSKKVVQLDLDNNVLAIYDSLHDAERKTGVWMTQIKKCCDKIPMYNTAKGYKWCWESELNG